MPPPKKILIWMPLPNKSSFGCPLPKKIPIRMPPPKKFGCPLPKKSSFGCPSQTNPHLDAPLPKTSSFAFPIAQQNPHSDAPNSALRAPSDAPLACEMLDLLGEKKPNKLQGDPIVKHSPNMDIELFSS